ncbi:MAG: hypothetical protein NVSMB2_09060 [Chloroflexota bacterium]
MQEGAATQTHIGLYVALVTIASVSAGCLPDPHHIQAQALFDQLSRARVAFTNPATLEDGCNTVGEVQTRLVGEPGLAEHEHGYDALRNAAAALQAVCGQGTLLREATAPTAASAAARARWTAGISHELDLACEHLRTAAGDLDRQPPC